MRALTLLIIICLSCTKIYATAQWSDFIIYEGKKYSLESNPLEPYFEKYPDKRPKNGIISSALWRGYFATFEIIDNQLFLKDIEIEVETKNSEKEFDTEWVSVLSEVFPNQEKVNVDWFSGLLVISYGRLVNYVHMGYGSTYSRYILLEIDEGNFIQAKRFRHRKYRKFKHKQFLAFKETEKYKELVAELSLDGYSSPEFIDKFLEDFIIDYTSKILTKERK